MYKDKEKQKEAQRNWVRQRRAESKGSTGSSTSLKRGKDIKCFEDLPPDVRQTIERMSDDSEEKQRRTAIAISCQHTYPDRYETEGLPVAGT